MKTETRTIEGKPLKITDETSHDFTGTVVITDPCYFIQDSVWTEMCDMWFVGHEPTRFANSGTIYFDGAKILYSSTAYGDGGYRIENTSNGSVTQNEFGVDAGMMAVITLEDFEKLTDETPTVGLYAVVEDFDGTIFCDGHGNFDGDLQVFTDGSLEEDEDEEEDDDAGSDWDTDEDDNW